MNDPPSQPLLPAPWWTRWPGRLEAELQRFTDLGLPVDVEEDPRRGDGRLVIRSEAVLEGKQPSSVVVVYPDGYPDRRFAVFAPQLRLSRHQSFGGILCVFPRDSRYWQPWRLAADVVATDVPELVRLVEAGGPELRAKEDPQGEPATEYYSYSVMGGVIVDGRALSLPADCPDRGALTISLDSAGARWLEAVTADVPVEYHQHPTGQGWLSSLRDDTGRELMDGGVPELDDRYPGPTLAGRWVRVSPPPYARSAEELWEAVTALDPHLQGMQRAGEGLQVVGLLTSEEVGQDMWAPAWVFMVRRVHMARSTRAQKRSRRPGAAAPRPVFGPVTLLRGLRWTEQDLAARIPELAPLREASVAIVGLGSLGAPLAAELAKARTGELHLADHDYLDPGTAVRHPLGLEHAGVSKPLAVGRWLNAQYPGTRIQALPIYIGAAGLDKPAVTEREMLGALFRGVHLMISATAENDVNRQLDRAAVELGVPRLYLWSISGYGGVVALLRQGRTGCYHCLELLERDRHAAGEDLVRVPAQEDGFRIGLVQGRGCGDRTFTAHHADLLPVVAQAARVAFGILCGPSGGYPESRGDVFSVQLRDPDGTPIPPMWTASDLAPDTRCHACCPP